MGFEQTLIKIMMEFKGLEGDKVDKVEAQTLL